MARTQIELDTPERTKPDKTAFNIRPKHLEPWIADLPRANLGETARQIYRVLKDSNQLAYPYHDRVQFLEMMREPVFYITSAMKKYFVGVNFPLNDKNYKVASACREILAGMATGYKIAIEDMLNNTLLFTDKKLLSKLIHRCLSSLGQVMLNSCQAYEPYPSNIWADINTLYHFAEGKKLADNEVGDPHHKHRLKTTIQEEYLRLLLVHLASPYRLKQGEVGKIFDSMENWASRCKLLLPNNQSEHSHFAVDLKSAEPPCSLALTAEKQCSPECRIINTAELAGVVQTQLKSSADMVTTTLPGIEMQRNELSYDLLRRLLLAWGVVPKRMFARTQKREPIQITLGLSTTHKVISDGNRNAPGGQAGLSTQTRDKFIQTARYNSATVSNVNDKQADIWDMIYPGTHKRIKPKEDETKADDAQSSVNAAQSYSQIETWSLVNESANGYCVTTQSNGDTNIQVGELLGVQRLNDGHTWKWGVGVIRWMKYEKGAGLVLGIEMLTPDAAAIGIKSAFSDNEEGYKRTLMLPEIPAIRQPKTLITGPVPFRAGNKLSMRILGKAIDILLTRELQNTGFFAQFEFDIVEHDAEKGPDQARRSETSDDFSSIWSII